jgi:hypothetical protein
MGLLEKSIGQHHHLDGNGTVDRLSGQATRGQSFEIDRKTAKQTSQTLLRGLKILELTAKLATCRRTKERKKGMNPTRFRWTHALAHGARISPDTSRKKRFYNCSQ